MNLPSPKPRPHSPRRTDQRGQTLTEFAMVLPLIAILLFGVIQFGIVFHHYVTLTDAVRAGGRQGAVSRDLASPSTAVENRVRSSSPSLDQSKLGVTVNSPFTRGSDVTVTATYPYQISLLGLVVTSGNLSVSTVERVE